MKSLPDLTRKAVEQGFYFCVTKDMYEVMKEGHAISTVYTLGGVFVVGGFDNDATIHKNRTSAIKSAITIAMRRQNESAY